MHEISLVQNLIEQLRQLASENKAWQVVSVTMEIGPFSGVVIESFQFGFDTLTANDMLLGKARLVIKTTDAIYRCSGCSHDEVSNSLRPDRCPLCGDHLLIPLGGDELILRQVEME